MHFIVLNDTRLGIDRLISAIKYTTKKQQQQTVSMIYVHNEQQLRLTISQLIPSLYVNLCY